MLKFCTTLLSVLGLVCVLVLSPISSSSAGFVDRDCSEFATQADAQAFFLSNGGPASDPHQLDGDGDGVACQANPCPCSTDAAAPPPPPPDVPGTQYGNVVRVVDGDTIIVRVGSVDETVRLIGIDTPESVAPGRPVECAARRASSSMSAMAQPGDYVALVTDPSQDARDAYSRLLAYVEEGGADLGRSQIKRGWATPYVYEAAFERLGDYAKARRSARHARRGVWRSCSGNFHKAPRD